MPRTPLGICVALLALVGIAGQVIFLQDSDSSIGAAMLFIVAGNLVIGVVIGLQVNPMPRTWSAIKTQGPYPSWSREVWAPTVFPTVAQAVVGTLLALIFAVGTGDAGTLVLPVITVVTAAASILGGFCIAGLLLWPVLTIGMYAVNAIAARTGTHTGTGTGTAHVPQRSGRARPGVDDAGALVSAMLLALMGLAIFGAIAVFSADSTGSRGFDMVVGILQLLFSYSADGPVNQPVAWVARGCIVALVALIALSYRSMQRTESRRTQKTRRG